MRRFGVLGLNAVLALAVSAILASGASAAAYPITALPQLGRCVPVTAGTGEWFFVHCQDYVAPRGNHNWLEGAAKNKFNAEFEGNKEGGPVELKTANPAHLITCQAGIIEEGEYIGSKSEKETIVLVGCSLVATKQDCHTNPSPTLETEIEISAEGSLGFIKNGKKPVAGWDLKGISAIVVCKKPPPEVDAGVIDKIEGSVIAPVTKTQSMFEEFTLKYKATGVKQIPEKFENEPTDVLSSTFGPTGSPEQTALIAKEIVTNEEPLEIKMACLENNGPHCK